MAQKSNPSEIILEFNNKQKLYIRYFTAILIDLTVLNLFDEYWDLVEINSFTISLLTAVLLQILLFITIKIEHRIGGFFKSKSGVLSKIAHFFSAWAVLFGSKLVILEALNIAFGEEVLFKGPFHGIVAFIAVIIVMLVTEGIATKITKSLSS